METKYEEATNILKNIERIYLNEISRYGRPQTIVIEVISACLIILGIEVSFINLKEECSNPLRFI